MQLKLLPRDQEIYLFVQSQARVDKERAIRRWRLKKLWARLHEIGWLKEVS